VGVGPMVGYGMCAFAIGYTGVGGEAKNQGNAQFLLMAFAIYF